MDYSRQNYCFRLLGMDNFGEYNMRLIRINTGIKNIDSSGQKSWIWGEAKEKGKNQRLPTVMVFWKRSRKRWEKTPIKINMKAAFRSFSGKKKDRL